MSDGVFSQSVPFNPPIALRQVRLDPDRTPVAVEEQQIIVVMTRPIKQCTTAEDNCPRGTKSATVDDFPHFGESRMPSPLGAEVKEDTVSLADFNHCVGFRH